MLILAKTRPGVADGRSPALARMVVALDSAEAAARLLPGAKRRLFLISYRVGEAGSGKVAADGRRSELVALIESRMPFETHVSTSTWIVRSYLRAAELLDRLSEPLEAECDFLSVAQVGSDRARFGNAGVKP